MNKKQQRITKAEKPKAIKGFKAVEWVRKVRDNMYEKNKTLDMKDYVKTILEKE
jgi:hypothetical protein